MTGGALKVWAQDDTRGPRAMKIHLISAEHSPESWVKLVLGLTKKKQQVSNICKKTYIVNLGISSPMRKEQGVGH